MKQLLSKEGIRQLLSYVCVGGAAAVVEWICFHLFSNVLNLNYILSTALAFIFSTAVNFILGRMWTFRNSSSYENKRVAEAVLVYGVSAIGLLFNMLLMYIFVSVLKLDTPLLKVVSKVAATGIVFIWNFLVRKLVIYRKTGDISEDNNEEND